MLKTLLSRREWEPFEKQRHQMFGESSHEWNLPQPDPAEKERMPRPRPQYIYVKPPPPPAFKLGPLQLHHFSELEPSAHEPIGTKSEKDEEEALTIEVD